MLQEGVFEVALSRTLQIRRCVFGVCQCLKQLCVVIFCSVYCLSGVITVFFSFFGCLPLDPPLNVVISSSLSFFIHFHGMLYLLLHPPDQHRLPISISLPILFSLITISFFSRVFILQFFTNSLPKCGIRLKVRGRRGVPERRLADVVAHLAVTAGKGRKEAVAHGFGGEHKDDAVWRRKAPVE